MQSTNRTLTDETHPINPVRITESDLESLRQLRRKLHAMPETAHKEFKTAETLKNYMADYKPHQVIDGLGGTGLAFVFHGSDGPGDGPTVLIRAELDALPIGETNQLDYRSTVPGVSHKCGHDGHMTIVAGLAHLLAQKPFKRGKVLLLFQPAEETGEGAEKVLADEAFQAVAPDYVFALHNLPGYQKHTIITRHRHFAGSSRGMMVTLKGKTSHAGEPENGRSPALAAAEIIKRFSSLVERSRDSLSQFALITIIFTLIGERAFGTAPGYGEVFATLRAFEDEDLAYISRQCVETVEKITADAGLQHEIGWTEAFPATVNDPLCVDLVREVAEELELPQLFMEDPFRWTEDFGHFTSRFRGVLFGLGAGKDTPQLHNPDYDFPEDLLQTGISVFYRIIGKVLDGGI